MQRFLIPTLVVLLGSLAYVQACFVEFTQQSYPPWECEVCGFLLYDGDAPTLCVPVNATFDNIAPGPLNGSYDSLNWKGFDVVTQDMSDGLTRQIPPYSEPQYASVASGTVGTLSGLYGGIYSMYYACVDALTGLAASCEVTIVAQCYQGSDQLGSTPEPITTTFLYEPSLEGNAMAYKQNVSDYLYDPRGFTGDACSSFAFSAVGLLETAALIADPADALIGPVDLLIDEVLIAVLEGNPSFGP